ncbi:hypothetical protein DXT99_18110 [Pontibacter diazotrophicus]|uniref:non-specific protein-tyrosine kinase n=1 Tax=Pontibacter diazotrophicus TaxID=1400979 RepID=A0A3D8L8G4_9BACT|nr:polysaccharide biosynthesis tyrosine autokinase [Pontibacter diazotrophicus]RDV13685.1 hypothetical protein DXT99_18110 [Pontibacter diazotrophicus]
MKKNNKDHVIDIRSWLFKFQTRWYVFAACVLVFLAIAYVFVQKTQRVYSFKSTLLLGDQQTGSKKAQELLAILDSQNKGIKVEDEIGIIQSAEMIRQALKNLDYTVSYYKVTDHWLNSITDLVVEEQYQDAPYEVDLDTSAYQLVDIPIVVEVLPDNKFEITAEAKDVAQYDFSNHTVVDFIPKVDIKQVLEFDQPYKDKYMSFKLSRIIYMDPQPGEKYYFVINSMDKLVGQQQKNLKIRPIERESRVLELTSEGSIPEKEIRFLNALMQEYVFRDLEDKNITGRKTLDFIDSQLAVLTDSLRRSKQAVSSFRSTNRLANINVQSNQNYEKLTRLESDRAKLVTDKIYFQNILEQVQNGDGITESVSPASASLQNPNLNNLFADLSELYKQKAGYRVNSTEDNPLLKVLEGKINNTRSAIIANLKNMVRSADVSINDVNQRITGIESTLAALPENERKLMDLQSEAEFVDKKYSFLLEKRAEAAIALATNATDKKIVDKASLAGNGPVNVKPKLIYMLALLMGLAIPAVVIALMDNVDNTIQGKNDLSAITRIPFLGVIAHGTVDDKLAVKNNPRSAIAESFRSMRVNLQYLLAGDNLKVIGVTSSVSGEGKTFCSVNLASELALSGKKVVLIESDMRKPTFEKYFNTKNDSGLSSYLTNGLPLEGVIQQTEVENLDIIPCGLIPDNAIHLLELPRMQELIDSLKDMYDYVVIDTPPIGFVSEFFILMRHLDTSLYVVKHKYTNKDMLDQVNELYAAKKLKNIYMVINDLDYNKTYEYGYKRKGHYYYA